MVRFAGRTALALLVGIGSATAAFAEPAVTLFKVVTVKDDVVIGLTPSELTAIGGTDAGSVARAIAKSGELTAWQYNVKKNGNGQLEQAPLRRIGILANTSLRVEPVASSLPVVAP
jgi:hypothetical protein